MKLIRKVAIYSTVGLLALTSCKAVRDKSSTSFVKMEDFSIDSSQSLSSAIEDEFDVTISKNSEECLDNPLTLAAYNSELVNSQVEEFADVASEYFAQRIKDDNPKYNKDDISTVVDEKSKDAFIVKDGEVFFPDSFLSDYITNVEDLKRDNFNSDKLIEQSQEVAKKMVNLAVLDVEMDDSILNKEVVVKKLK